MHTNTDLIGSDHPYLKNSWLWRQINSIPINDLDTEKKKLISELQKHCISHFLTDRTNNEQTETAFYEKAKTRNPPKWFHCPLKTKTSTFNHVNQYALNDTILWHKPLEKGSETWKPIYFEGDDKGIIPETIQSDGANLIVIGNNEVFYKKVLEETRDINTQVYSYKDVSSQNNWIPAWFSLPIAENLQNPFADNHLMLPPRCRGFAISHRAEKCGQVQDALGVTHLNPLNVTSFFVLEEFGRFIILYDPYVNISAHFIIPLPETAHSSFEAIHIAAACSTLLVIGYEIKPHQDGGVTKTLKAITWFVDHDLLGNNPMIKYDYPVNAPQPASFMLPMLEWKEHLLDSGSISYKDFTIFQTGSGNEARTLRIPGWNQEETPGYFEKQIAEEKWTFVNFEHGHEFKQKLNPEIWNVDESFTTSVKNYQEGKLTGKMLPASVPVSIKLTGIGPRTFQSILELKIDDKIYKLLLHRIHGILNFIFPSLPLEYRLVLPQLPDHQIQSLFNNVTPVTVTEDENGLTIVPTFLSGQQFEIKFAKT